MKEVDERTASQPDEQKQPTQTSNQPAQKPQTISPVTSRTDTKRHWWVGIAVAAGIILCLGVGFGSSQLFSTLFQETETTSRPAVANDGNKIITSEEESIAGVVEKVSPSVVSILTTSQTVSPYGVAEEQGAGTGIIVGKDGYVMTNKHVVNGTNTVSVVLTDGTTYDKVKVLGADPLNDVAFLKIPNVSNLPTAELGDSTSIRVGQKVVAIGNSLGQYQNTVTSGIISGTGRPVSAQAGESVENLTDLIQTDAAINPGNSGGPLLNLSGQVIGINTAIIENAQGIGFAIPIGATKGMLKGVLAGGGVERAYLGVNYLSITADVASHYQLPVKKGAYVFSTTNQSAVIPNGPAAKAGIQDKDIITKVGDIEIGDKGGMASLISEYAPGDTVELTVLRGGQTVKLKVTLTAYKA